MMIAVEVGRGAEISEALAGWLRFGTAGGEASGVADGEHVA